MRQRDRRRSRTASYPFTAQQEDDGVGDQPITYCVEVTVDGDELIVDWTGTDPQARGPINATYGVIAGAVYNGIFHLTDANIPKNAGAYRPIRIIAPPGSAVNVLYPRPCVAGNTESHPKLADMVIAALAPALPDRVAAAEGGTACNFLFGGVHPKTRRLLRQLPPGGRRLGRDVLRRREQRDHRQERQLPEHAGRDLRDPLSAPDDRVLADRRLGRSGDETWRPGHEEDRPGDGGCRDHGERACSTGRSRASERGGSRAAVSEVPARSASSAAAIPASERSPRCSGRGRPRSSRTSSSSRATRC